METTKVRVAQIENNVADFENLPCNEKLNYIFDTLCRIKPECFKDSEEPKKPLKLNLGDFWVNLKDAEGYDWKSYDCEDFLVTLRTSNPNNTSYSADADSYTVAYPHDFYEKPPKNGGYWNCGDHVDRPNWFTTHNINEGAIWVKPIIIHPVKDEEDDD